MSSLTNTQFVDSLYVDFLLRDAEPAGETYYVNLLASGQNTRADLIGFFTHSPEYLGMEHHGSYALTAGSVAPFSNVATLDFQGGSSGWVMGAARNVLTVNPGSQANGWTETNIVNNHSSTGEQVATYSQANADNGGWTAASVSEAKLTGTVPGTVVAQELDAGTTVPGSVAVGLDVVNSGGMTAAIRVPDGVPALVDASHPETFIEFLNGHIIAVVGVNQLVLL